MQIFVFFYIIEQAIKRMRFARRNVLAEDRVSRLRASVFWTLDLAGPSVQPLSLNLALRLPDTPGSLSSALFLERTELRKAKQRPALSKFRKPGVSRLPWRLQVLCLSAFLPGEKLLRDLPPSRLCSSARV